MFILTIYDHDNDNYESFPRLISAVAQENDDLCFSYLDALGNVITDVYHMNKGDNIRIGLMK